MNLSSFETGDYTLAISLSDIEDDQKSSFGMPLGETVTGSLDYAADVNHFTFQAESGLTYQIYTKLGTLFSSKLTLYDSQNRKMASNDNYGDNGASRIIWKAPASGEYRLEVSGFWADGDGGSFELTVDLSDLADGYRNFSSDAAEMPVGSPVKGTLNYPVDTENFSFQADEGRIYLIDVALGTLRDSKLHISGGSPIYNDDYTPDSRESRITWKAPRSREYFVWVNNGDLAPIHRRDSFGGGLKG